MRGTKEEDKIYTDLFVKPADSTLHFDSSQICREGNPFGQFLLLRRICTHNTDFVRHVLIKAKHFLQRGYLKQLPIEEMVRATLKDRDNLLHPILVTPTPTQPQQQIVVTTFHPGFKGLRPLIDKNWDVLGGSYKTTYLHNRKLTVGLCKPTNIRDLVVRARTDFHPQQSNPHNKTTSRTYNICSKKNCRYCIRLDTMGQITSKTTGCSYNTKINVSCKSSNLIYCLHCTRCGHQYVGQTECKPMARM